MVTVDSQGIATFWDSLVQKSDEKIGCGNSELIG